MSDEDEFVIAQRRIDMRKRTREEAESILRLAGLETSHVWELANRYWPDSPVFDDVRKPWWLFMTDVGLIQLGWRKRVLHIDWEATSVRTIVTEDEVTKSETHVHAWSVEKAVAYLRSLKRVADLDAPDRIRP